MQRITPKKHYGDLRVLGEAGTNWQNKMRWACQCSCGKRFEADAYQVRAGRTTSCGCAQKEATRRAMRTHGMSGSLTYKSWCAMRARCDNSRSVQFKHYGGRGIGYQRSWRHFENFLADMGERPSVQHELDRKDPNKNYSKANCAWGLKYTGISTRSVRFEGKSIEQWAQELGLTTSAVSYRIRKHGTVHIYEGRK